ncbi:MAG: ribosome recycling factor [Planctomycetota bacterium]|nr:ribosome recycling factor [Planctomycetota bacterium]
MTFETIIPGATKRMDKALAHTKEQLRGIRTSRASSALIENIRVDYYGTPTPLSQMAQISVPEPRQLMVKPFDATIIKEIEKALSKSDLGIPLESDGKVLRLNLPPLSGDQRKLYASKCRDICEEGRVALRNVRRDANKESDNLLKSKEITEDDNKGMHTDIQDLLKKFEGMVNDLQERKDKEILEV